MTEYFRQFAFVASLLGGFSFAFFGTLIGAPREHRVVGPAAALTLAASTRFLVVTLGNLRRRIRRGRRRVGAQPPLWHHAGD